MAEKCWGPKPRPFRTSVHWVYTSPAGRGLGVLGAGGAQFDPETVPIDWNELIPIALLHGEYLAPQTFSVATTFDSDSIEQAIAPDVRGEVHAWSPMFRSRIDDGRRRGSRHGQRTARNDPVCVSYLASRDVPPLDELL